MARTPGAVAKNKVPQSQMDHEGLFLTELTDRYNFWKSKGELEYAEAYKVLIHRFTMLEETKNED